MKKLIASFFCIIPLLAFAQDFSDKWTGHFSYYNVQEVVQGNNKIYSAADNSIFSIDTNTSEIENITTVNGLSGEGISTLYYSNAYQLLVVGYDNGLIEIVFDNDPDVLTVVDIVNRVTIPATTKKINHINAFDNKIYIATNYGISVYNLERLEFEDTYFIGNNGSQIPITQTTIFNGFIYATSLNNNGIKKADITNLNLIDFSNWQTVTTGNFIGIEAIENKLYAVATNRIIYNVVNDVLNQTFQYEDVPLEIKSVNNNLLITTANNTFVYDANFNLIAQSSATTESFNTAFNSSTFNEQNIYVGTRDFGVLKSSKSNPDIFEEIRPAGPLRNDLFSIKYSNNNLWGVSGGYNLFYNFIGGDRLKTGISRLKNNTWQNIPYDSISNKIKDPVYLSHIAINPFKPEQVFVSSYTSGLIEFSDNEAVGLFNQDNSTLIPFAANFKLIGPSNYDSDGVLWLMNGRVDKALNKFENGNWTSFDISAVLNSAGNELGFSEIITDNSGINYIGTYTNGVVAFNENRGNPRFNRISEANQNMPSDYVTALALDNRDQLWIGTFDGLRVLFNTSSFFTEETPTVDNIVIEEDGIAKELLFEQHITDIEVDGSNNKWIATSEAGLFYLTPNGQTTIFHFTKDNSPLPSNTVNDVTLDDENGIVYISTSRGLVSFNSGSSSTRDDLTSVFAYPNPVRPNFNITDEKIKIKGITENINIKITDVEGNLVAEAQSRVNQRFRGFNLEIDGGTALWNGKNLANNTVASGVYLVMLSDLETFETKVLKLMIVR